MHNYIFRFCQCVILSEMSCVTDLTVICQKKSEIYVEITEPFSSLGVISVLADILKEKGHDSNTVIQLHSLQGSDFKSLVRREKIRNAELQVIYQYQT